MRQRSKAKEGLESVQLQHWVRAVANGKPPTIKHPETQEIIQLPMPLARTDGEGLTFTLSRSGTASWILRYRSGGRYCSLFASQPTLSKRHDGRLICGFLICGTCLGMLMAACSRSSLLFSAHSRPYVCGKPLIAQMQSLPDQRFQP